VFEKLAHVVAAPYRRSVPSALTSPPPALKRWAARLALAVALAISLAYVPYRLLDPVGTGHLRDLRAKLDTTQLEQQRLELENDQLRREIQGLRGDPSVIEDIARDDLGLVRDDEIVIRIDRAPRGAR